MSDKKTYRVRNWREYNKALVQRGSRTLWICEDVLEKWRSSSNSGKRGRPETYPNDVISCALQVKAWYHLTFRALEGFLGSLIELLKLDLKIPHYSTLAKRQKNLDIELPQLPRKSAEPLHLVVDSTGLKVFGEGEWKVFEEPIAALIADGAYDRFSCYETREKRADEEEKNGKNKRDTTDEVSQKQLCLGSKPC